MAIQVCSNGGVLLSASVVVFLILYSVFCGVVLLVFLGKGINFGLQARRKRSSSPSKDSSQSQKLRQNATDRETIQAAQGLAIKRLLFHNMNGGGEMGPKGADSHATNRMPWETDVKKIKFKRKIGAGNFGEVWEGSWMQSNVAVKTVLKSMANNHEFVAKFIEEIQLMSELNHPNIVMFLGASIQPPSICLILEYCVHGNLIEFLQSAKTREINISMHLLLKMALDIARGIKYLHEKVKIIQRDIKGRNVLVDENLNAKIADFGLSRLKSKSEDAGLTACGTPAWTAPEVVRMEEYTEKVDVYSFGVVLWELFMREEPYAGEGGIQVAYAAAEQGLRPEVPMYAPERYAELMQECWADSPEDRPNFGQILERLFQMMKDESNPLKTAEFYFGRRRHTYDESVQELLDDRELNQGLFAEDYLGILEDRKRALKNRGEVQKRAEVKPRNSRNAVRILTSSQSSAPLGGLAALLPMESEAHLQTGLQTDSNGAEQDSFVAEPHVTRSESSAKQLALPAVDRAGPCSPAADSSSSITAIDAEPFAAEVEEPEEGSLIFTAGEVELNSSTSGSGAVASSKVVPDLGGESCE